MAKLKYLSVANRAAQTIHYCGFIRAQSKQRQLTFRHNERHALFVNVRQAEACGTFFHDASHGT